MTLLQRQMIDAKYTTGSGEREAADFLDEREQIACDFNGQDVVLGEQIYCNS